MKLHLILHMYLHYLSHPSRGAWIEITLYILVKRWC